MNASEQVEQVHTTHKTCRRINEPGHAHALTFSCYRRRPFLLKDRARAWLIEAIDAARHKHTFDLWAYVIMPEHVHLLIFPTKPDYRIGAILTSLKQPVSKRARLFIGSRGDPVPESVLDVRPDGRRVIRFWQRGGGYDRNLWSPRHVWEAIDYMHANPVRRGLCDSDVEWFWSSARAYHGIHDGLLEIDAASLPDDPRWRKP